MAKRKKSGRGEHAARLHKSNSARGVAIQGSQRRDAARHLRRATSGPDVPKWIGHEGNFYWHEKVIIHLAAQASAERAILDEFERHGWPSVIENPIERGEIGDPTQSRRSAIWNLNHHQGEPQAITFFSVAGGFVGWRFNRSAGRV